MSEGIALHLHIHDGASPAAVEAAVRAAIGAGGTVRVPDESADIDRERSRRYWERAYNESANDAEGRARPLLKFLSQHPERLIPYTEVSDALGFTNSRSLPGLLGAFGRRAKHRYRGVQPFERRWTDGQWNLWMSTDAATVIRRLI